MSKLEKNVEKWFFATRWLLAPFFIGLIIAILALLFKFSVTLFKLVIGVFENTAAEVIISTLTLVDTALLAGLLLIVAFSGYENFVSKLGVDDHEDRPSWMGKVGFSALKMKLISAIVAISTVELLKVFINLAEYSPDILWWKVGIHTTFVVSGVLFALTDYIARRP
ncbi:TIGR00645 family protein [Salinibius halmophilus]|uniref:TIGR00645 family protein n=1 Tax=Salinibius halmophilus TaxID=1853216 RepID=UPI000E662A2E|nr:TIGR00645 family protein [Salinibius halmophilus]